MKHKILQHAFSIAALVFVTLGCTTPQLVTVYKPEWMFEDEVKKEEAKRRDRAARGALNIFPQGAFSQEDELATIVANGFSTKGDVSLVTNEAPRFLRMSKDARGDTFVVATGTIVTSWRKLRLIANVRTGVIEGKRYRRNPAHIRLIQYDGTGKRVGAAISLRVDAKEWKELSEEISVHPSASIFELTLSLHEYATFDIESVALEASGPEIKKKLALMIEEENRTFQEQKEGFYNVLPQGLFEKMELNAELSEGWRVVGYTLLMEDEGNNVVRAKSGSATGAGITYTLPLQSGWKTLLIRTRYRARNVVPGERGYQNAKFYLRFNDSGGGKISSHQYNAESFSWKTLNERFDIPAGAASLEIWAGPMSCEGDFFIDDIIVKAKGEGVKQYSEELFASRKLDYPKGNIFKGGMFDKMETKADLTNFGGIVEEDFFKNNVEFCEEPNGNKYVRVTVDTPSNEKLHVNYSTYAIRHFLPVDTEAWGVKTVKIKLRYRGTVKTIGKKVYEAPRVMFTTYADKTIEGKTRHQKHAELRASSDEWQTHEFITTIGASGVGARGIKYLAISYGFWGASSGVLEVDDISVEVTPIKRYEHPLDFKRLLFSKRMPREPYGAFITKEDEARVNQTFYVSVSNENASDENDGSKARPFATIEHAYHTAYKTGKPTRILLTPGIYRQTVTYTGTGEYDEPLVIFEAETPETAIIDGSENWTGGWEKEGNIYVKDWTNAWGFDFQPFAKGDWHVGLVYLLPRGMRHEYLFVNTNTIVEPFLGKGDLIAPNRFAVDEKAGKIYFYPPEGVDPNNDMLSISTRRRVINIMRTGNLVFRNLTIRHVTGRAQGGAMWVVHCHNVLVDNVLTHHNGTSGMTVSGRDSRHITMRRVRAYTNGMTGYGAGRRYVLFDGCEAVMNNWRGHLANFYGFAVAGNKNFGCRYVMYKNSKILDNLGTGIWYDWANEHVTLDNVRFVNNMRDALYIEASPGPNYVKNCFMQGHDSGLLNAESWFVHLYSNTIYDNRNASILVRTRERVNSDFDTGDEYAVNGGGMVAVSNTIAVYQKGETLMKQQHVGRHDKINYGYELHVSMFQGKKNRYYDAQTKKTFDLVGRNTVDLEEWAKAVESSEGSVWEDPQLFRVEVSISEKPKYFYERGSTLTISAKVYNAPDDFDKVVYYAISERDFGMIPYTATPFGIKEVGESRRAPYTVEWEDLPAGGYAIYAKAFHKNGDYIVNVERPIITVPRAEPEDGHGYVKREIWHNVAGKKLADFKKKGEPDVVTYDEMTDVKYWPDNGYMRVTGYLHPEETGTHRVTLVGHDEAILRISTDDTPENLQKVCHHTSKWGIHRQWYVKRNEEQFGRFDFQAGNRYYFEMVVKAGENSGYRKGFGQFGWITPKGVYEMPITSKNISFK